MSLIKSGEKRRMQKHTKAKYLEVWFGKGLKALYLISHNLLFVTNTVHYNLHLNSVK